MVALASHSPSLTVREPGARPWTQWAAVSTTLTDTRLPPQMKPPVSLSAEIEVRPSYASCYCTKDGGHPGELPEAGDLGPGGRGSDLDVDRSRSDSEYVLQCSASDSDILDGVWTGHPAVSVGVGGQRGAARARRGGGRRGHGLGVRAAHLAQGAVAAEIECSGSIGDDVLQIEIKMMR